MLKVLIDDHPAGWSTINHKDFSLEAGFQELRKVRGQYKASKLAKPECYCHGDRSDGEEGWLVTHENASGSGCEYVYGFDEGPALVILSSFCDDGAKMIGMFGTGDPAATWKEIARIALDGPEPEWETLNHF